MCDAENGFWHIELDEDSSYLTTFGTPYGRYQWLKMPFGISPTPEYFQHCLDQGIEGLPGVRTVADDILLTLLERCREKGVKLSKEKFKLKMTAIPYIGHVLTRDGLKPDPSKIDTIKEMSRPTDVKGVQRLVGLANYLTKFLEKLADIWEPLQQLTRKDAEWHWSNVHVLQYFGPSKRQCFSTTPQTLGLEPRSYKLASQ